LKWKRNGFKSQNGEKWRGIEMERCLQAFGERWTKLRIW
jgi:hypothetical protein